MLYGAIFEMEDIYEVFTYEYYREILPETP